MVIGLMGSTALVGSWRLQGLRSKFPPGAQLVFRPGGRKGCSGQSQRKEEKE
jgi:hypothetical protein